MKILQRIKLIGITLLGISVLLLSSCSNSPENLKTIPNETNIVSVIDIYSIIKKGGLYKLSELKFFKKFKKEIRNENKQVNKIIDNIIEDPTISGIDFKTDVFAYLINEARDEKYVCISAEIKNEEKFAEFIDDVLDKLDVKFDIEDENEYKYTIVENELAIGWDKDKVILLVAANRKSRKNLDEEIETLISLEEKDQITENDEFNKFYKNKKDISVWVSTNLFEDIEDFKEITRELDFDISDSYCSSYLNFEDDHISLLTQVSPNKEIQKMMDENDVWNNKFNSELLDFLPEQSYAVASLSLNPVASFNLLKKTDSFEQLQSEVEKEKDMSGFFNRPDVFQPFSGLNLKKLFNSIKGNVVYSLFGFENIEYSYLAWGYGFNENAAKELPEKYEISQAGYLSVENKELLNQGETIQAREYNRRYCINIKNIIDNGGTIESAIRNNDKINWYEGGWEYGKNIETTEEELLPLMGLVIDINDNKMIKKLIKIMPEDKITKRGTYYEFTFDDRYPSYFAFNENICFITNDKKSIKVFKDGGYSANNLSDSGVKSGILNNSVYTFLNLNYDEYPKDIKKEIKDNQSDREEKLFEIWNEFAKSIELKQINKNSVEIIFKTHDDKNNTLNSIITTIDDDYKYFMPL